MPALVQKMELNQERMRAAITPDLYATDVAVELAAKGVPFRTAYRQVADSLASLGKRKPERASRRGVAGGSGGILMLETLRARLAGESAG